MKLNFDKYKDKVYACWIGKNIGGTMGAPYEGCRKMLDIKGFATEPDVVLPNDDLDLQLIWLYACERVGPNNITSAVLGEFWLSYITPYWNEYGIGKANMTAGLNPPMSGSYKNNWNDSNGAWIRTEIWASLSPGCPDAAAHYATEDAIVDHGTGEGTYAAAFVAGMQSAAFALSDIRKAIEAGLSRIPKTSRVAESVLTVLNCYDSGKAWQDARNTVQKMNEDIGDGWFEAPSNVAYAVIGLLYGEGDFKKTMITAINCGDDTDCTGATAGATFGILHGTDGIPDDWKKHIGDRIVTVSISKGMIGDIALTCSDLTERVVSMAPVSLKLSRSTVTLSNGEDDISDEDISALLDGSRILEKLEKLKPYSFETKFGPVKALTDYHTEPEIAAGEEKSISITFSADRNYADIPYNLRLRWLLPDGFAVEGPKSVRLVQKTVHGGGSVEETFTVKAEDNIAPVNRLVLEIEIDGRLVVGYIPVVFLGK